MQGQEKIESRENGLGSGPVQDAPEEGKKYLVFRMGEFWLALAIEAIKRLYDAQAHPPRTPGSKLIDLRQITGDDAQSPVGYWIEMEIDGGRYLMTVDDVEGIQEFNLCVVMEYPSVLKRPQTKYYKKLFFDGLRMMTEIDPAGIAGTTPGLPGVDPGFSLGQELENETESKPVRASERIVIFESGGGLWSLDLGLVAQIINRDDIYPLPAAGPIIMGVCYYAEQAIPVMSPADMVRIITGERPRIDDRFSMVIIAETERGLLGIGCDRIVRVANRQDPGKSVETQNSVARNFVGPNSVDQALMALGKGRETVIPEIKVGLLLEHLE